MKKYQIIYADPPWPVKKIIRKSRPNQHKNLDYPTMSLPDIISIQPKRFADDTCHLFLWTTHGFLKEAFIVMDNWGFKYQRVITWDKQNGMCLFGFHHRTEFCLYGYSGKINMYPRQKAIPTIWTEKSPRHSQKPDGFRKAIEIFGDSRLEMFARTKTEGWDVWGNEVESDIDLRPEEGKI